MSDKIIITTDGGSKTIENVNPAARNAELAQFGEKIADLTTGQYVKTDRVTTVNCDTEPGGGTKPTPTITLSQDTISIASLVNYDGTQTVLNLTVTTNSDGGKYIRFSTSGMVPLFVPTSTGYNVGKVADLTSPVAQTAYIGFTETDNYAAAEVALTITA